MSGQRHTEQVDVLVAGSGAAGLVAALRAALAGARVLLAERATEIGGTTAISGGRLWVPANGRPGNDGDTLDAARQYLTGLYDDRYAQIADAFLATAAPMTEFVERRTPHRFAVCPNYPDYHPDRPGVRLGGRCLDMSPLDTAGLHPRVAEVRRPPGYLPMTHAEWERWRYPARYDHDLLRQREQRGVLTNGPALVTALLHAVLSAGAEVVTGTRVAAVRRDGDGLLATLAGPHGDTTLPVPAVVLATGGFDWDSTRRNALLPGPVAGLGSAPTNTGDGLAIAESLGAATDNLGDGWWMPMVAVPGETVGGEQFYRGLVRERGAPRQFIVNPAGRRFVDEAVPYNEIGKAMHRTGGSGEYPNAVAHMIFDAGFHRRYPLPGITPGQPVPEWVPRAGTLAELARVVGVDPAGLAATGEQWNAMARAGVDQDFGRGANPYDVYYGDDEVTPNPCMAPLDEPPFYAVQVLSGSAGTKGGPVTDVDGQVLDHRDQPVAGVFAVGNATAFWTADGYPGPGATLAAGMAFGYRAGLRAAEHASSPVSGRAGW